VPTAAHLLRLARDAAPTDGPPPPDTELLQRYVAVRDEAAFAELVRRDGPLVLRACRHILGEGGADDAFQATFLLLVRSARRLTRPGSLAGWLHAAAVRIATNARRGEERRRERERSRPIRSASPDDLTWREVREVLDREIAALPESYRLPVVLCHIQELGYEEAARRAGCPVGALRGRLERGKDQLRKRLARYGLPLAAPALVLGAPPPVSAALIEATMSAVRSGLNGTVPPALAGLLRPTGGLRMVLFVTPAAVILAALGAVIAASALTPKPPKSDPASALRSSSSPSPVPVVDANGDPLPAGAVMRLGTTRFRHGEWVRSVAFSPDGMQIASASFDNTVRIWDRETGKELRRLKGPFLEPHTVLYVNGGKQIVTAEGWYSGREANPIRIWDAQSGQLVRILVERGPRTKWRSGETTEVGG
jgi:RNA polymerase sigma factor (sigma-70 family)